MALLLPNDQVSKEGKSPLTRDQMMLHFLALCQMLPKMRLMGAKFWVT